jgi:hypothetical protein
MPGAILKASVMQGFFKLAKNSCTEPSQEIRKDCPPTWVERNLSPDTLRAEYIGGCLGQVFSTSFLLSGRISSRGRVAL